MEDQAPQPLAQESAPDAPVIRRYAGFNARLIAAMLDMVIIMFLLLQLGFIVAPVESAIQGLFNVNFDPAFFEQKFNESNTLSRKLDAVLQSGLADKLIVSGFIAWIWFGVYAIPFWYYRAATPGKMLIGAKIMVCNSNLQPNLSRLITRYAGYLLCGLTLGLGFLYIGINAKKAGLHDKLAGTEVIFTRKPLLERLLKQKGSPENLPKKIWHKYMELFKSKEP
jgi:uncharacterized RDD family membrane protein YckC